jgi:hypothetical protein
MVGVFTSFFLASSLNISSLTPYLTPATPRRTTSDGIRLSGRVAAVRGGIAVR